MSHKVQQGKCVFHNVHTARTSAEVYILYIRFFYYFDFQEWFSAWQILVMADDSEWTKLPTEDKCLHKVCRLIIWYSESVRVSHVWVLLQGYTAELFLTVWIF